MNLNHVKTLGLQSVTDLLELTLKMITSSSHEDNWEVRERLDVELVTPLEVTNYWF